MSRPHQSSIANNITSPENRQSPLEDDMQQRQADRLAQHVFPEPDATGKAVEVIWSFIRSYDRHRHEMPLEQWLIQELARYPHLWQDNAEAEQVARMLIASLTRTNLHKESLQQHLDKGKSAANWLASELEQDARGNPELNLGEYAGQVRDMLLTGNQTLARGLAPDTPHTTVPTNIAVPAGVATVWDENSRLEIAREIDNQALLNAALNAAGQGARILGRRAWNWLRDVENAPASEALQEFFNSSLKSAKHVGAQVAVSGGVVVATRSGWLGLPRNTPVEELATTAYTGLERAKTLYKLGQGDILADTAINAIEQTTMVAARSLAQAAAEKGAELGTQWGTKLGSVFGPAGAGIGGMLGGIAGGAAGEAVGSLIEKGGRKVVEVARKVVSKVSETVKAVGSAIASGVKDLVSSLKFW